jgi:hypothetical protein
VHDSNNDWAVGDAVYDANESKAAVVAHIGHVVQSNSSVSELADLPSGWQAPRAGPGHPWIRSRYLYDGE